MTSEERREGRYQRRKAKRQKRKEESNKEYGDYDKAISMPALIKAYRVCRKGTSWKPSVQRYGANLLKNSYKQHMLLVNGSDTFKGFYTFDVYERGKKRAIRAVHISERTIQKSISKNSFVPMLSNAFIYDNYASLKGKGTALAIDRMTDFLHWWYRRHGNEGYVICGDFKNYFGSIDHNEVIRIIKRSFTDPRFAEYTATAIAHYPEGLGLGSEENQIYAMALPNDIDHYIKDKKGIKTYSRYNDDFRLICRTKEEAKALLEEIRELSRLKHITLHPTKTQIVKLSHGFNYLKTRFILTGSGKVIRIPNKNRYKRERRKLKALAEDNRSGEITKEYIEEHYKTWRGQLFPKKKQIKYKHFNCYRCIQNMDAYYKKIMEGVI